MNIEPKAGMQRKLSRPAAPTPPIDLADRIKRDIPNLASTAPVPARPTISRFGLGIAASLVVLTGSAWFAIHLLNRNQFATGSPVAIQRSREPSMPSAKAVTNAGAADERSASLPMPPQASLDRSLPQLPHHESDSGVSAMESRRPDGSLDEDLPAKSQTESAPAVAETAPAAAPVPRPALPSRDAMGGSAADIVGRAEANQRGGMARETQAAAKTTAADAQFAPESVRIPSSEIPSPPSRTGASRPLFGVPSGEAELLRVRAAIERGETPRQVDTPAIINYFARSPLPIGDTISLDAELSVDPIEPSSHLAILRVSIDMPHAAGGRTRDLVAFDTRLDIMLEPATGATLVRNGAPLHFREPVLTADTSATLLYRLDLRAPLAEGKTLATVRLQYRPPGQPVRTITKIVTADGMQHPWRVASPRQRMASLAAALTTQMTERQRENAGYRAAPPAPEERTLSALADELEREESGGVRAHELAFLIHALYPGR